MSRLQSIFNKIWPRRLHNKIIWGVVVVQTLLLGFFAVDIITQQKRITLKQNKEQAKSLAQALAVNARFYIISNDEDMLLKTLQSVNKFPELEYAAILESDGKVLAHTNPVYLGMKLADGIGSKGYKDADGSIIFENSNVADVAMPIYDEGGSRLIGWAKLALNRNSISKEFSNIVRDVTLYMLLGLLVSVIIAYFIGKNLSKELNILSGITAKIAEGHVRERALGFKSIEVERLGKAFNRMLDEISGNQQLLKTVMENLPVGVWVLNEKGEIISANPEAGRIWGGAKYVGPENYGEYKAWYRLSRKKLEAEDWAFSKVMKTGKSVLTDELEIECFDGSRKIIINSAVPIRDEQGLFKGGIVINVDLTGIRSREEELLLIKRKIDLSEATLRAVFDRSPIGMLLVTPGLKIIQANRGSELILGYGENELTGMMIGEISHPEDLEKDLPFINKLAKSQHGTYRTEKRYKRKDGSCVWCSVSVSDVRDTNGEQLYNIVQIEDITERKQSEERIKESERYFRFLLDNVNVGIIQHKADTTIKIFNNAALTMLGLTGDQLLGITSFDPLWNVIHEDGSDFPPETHPVAVAAKTGKPVKDVVMGVYRPLIKDRVWLNVNATPFFLSDKQLDHIIVTFADISEIKKVQLEVTKLNRLYKFIGTINEMILRDTTWEEIMEQACQTAVNDGGFKMAWIGLYNESTKKVKPLAWAGHEDGYLTNISITADEKATAKGPTGRAIRYKKYQYCDDIANDPDMLPWRDEALKRNFRSSISLPIMVKGNLEAVFTLYMTEPYFFSNPQEIDLLLKVTNDIAYALDNLRMADLQMKAERELEASEEMNRAILNAFPDRIFRVKENGIIIEVQTGNLNELARLKDLTGKKIKELTSPDTADKLMIALHKSLLNRKLQTVEYEVVEHGMQFFFEGRMIAISGDEVLFIARNITEAKMANAALEKKVKEVADLRYALDEGTIVDIADQNGVITHINDNFCAISKFSRQELIGQNHRLLNSGHHPSSFFKELWTTVQTGKIWRGEVLEKARDGSSFWLDTTIVPFINEKGKPYQYVSIRKDITERKKAEEDLDKSYKIIQERVKELNCLYQSAEIAYKSEGSMEQIISKILSIIPSAYQFPESAVARITFDGKEYCSPSFKESSWRQQAEVKILGDNVGKVEVFYLKEMPSADEGPFLKEERMMIDSIADILANTAERKHFINELKESEAKFRSLVETMPVGVFILDEVGFRYVSPGFVQMFGYTEVELLGGINAIELTHPDDKEKVKQAVNQKLSGEIQHSHYSIRAIKKDGTLFFVEIISARLIYQGRPVSIGAIFDITDKVEEEKRIGKAVNDAQEKERLQIGMELHDNVKQIMAASLMSLGFAKDRMDENPEVAVQTIDNVRDYIREAIQELRRLSHQLAPSADTNLPLAEKIRMLADNMNSAKTLDIHITADDFEEPLTDEIQLAFYRILQEQLSNILKYAKATIAEIIIERADKNVMLTIRDNGKGFDPSVKKDGIGLENIKRRVNVLGGEARIISSPGKGCSVVVKVPFSKGN